MFYTNASTTLSAVRGVLRGTTPGVRYSINYGADISLAGTIAASSSALLTSTTTGTNATIFNQPIPDNNYVWLNVISASGTITDFNVSVEF
jgi:hypothetical protein